MNISIKLLLKRNKMKKLILQCNENKSFHIILYNDNNEGFLITRYFNVSLEYVREYTKNLAKFLNVPMIETVL
jgi:hypothetical protein